MYTYSWFILLYNRNWYSSVKHPHYNLKNIKQNKVDYGDDCMYLWSTKTKQNIELYTLNGCIVCCMKWHNKTLLEIIK